MTAERFKLTKIYKRLFKTFGSRNWWPADSKEEVIFGAILAQNTTWKNVEQALNALKETNMLSFKAVVEMGINELAELVRPARFLNQKAKTLKVFGEYFGKKYRFSIKKMAEKEMWSLREELLGLYRIGPETADSILLYALEKPLFVIDAYTKRIFSRHGLISAEKPYDELQSLFMRNLPSDVPLYNEFHALIVHLGNLFCKPKPQCEKCPLQSLEI